LIPADLVADNQAAGILSAVDGAGPVIVNGLSADSARQPESLPIFPVPFVVGCPCEERVFA
jgi:hypothetical protein